MATSPTRSLSFAAVCTSALVASFFVLFPAPAAAQGSDERDPESSTNPPRIWEERGPIEQLDLLWGSGSPHRAPAGPFTFVAEDLGGSNPKAHVRDTNGVLWGVKWDEEVHAEVAASRLAWAMGLRVDETYYVPAGRIVFAGRQRPTLQRIGQYIDRRGDFKSGARFERWEPTDEIKGDWSFEEHPLMAEGGYSVMVLMNVIMANWDAKDANNKLLSTPGTAGTTDWYMVGDYGACFGKMGGQTSHSKYGLSDFLANPPVVRSVSGDTLYLNYKGSNAAAHQSVPLAGARFFARQAARLTLAQVEDAFRAANAADADRPGFAEAVYGRIREVVTAAQ